MDFQVLLTAARAHLSSSSSERLAPLFAKHRLLLFQRRLERLCANDIQTSPAIASIEGETTPDVTQIAQAFGKSLQLAKSGGTDNIAKAETMAAQLLEDIQVATLLALLGQRTTASSVSDERAFPPAFEDLIDAASQPCNDSEDLSVAARALAKHTSRDDRGFWGDQSGPVDQQNQQAINAIHTIHRNTTWWNVFEHFQQGLIYEVRVESGHGARWSHDGRKFIGFVEPFDANTRLEQTSRDNAAESEPAADLESEAAFPPLPEIVDRKVISERYSSGQRRFENLDLSGIDLQNLELCGIVLKGSNLARAKLFNTNLEGADLSDCDLRHTFLAKTRLSGVTARRTNFQGSRMDGVQWNSIDLQNANLCECNLRGSILESCQMKATKFRNSDLSNSEFRHCRMYGVGTEGANWSNARIMSCVLSRSYIDKTDFSCTRFEHCKLESAQLAGSIFADAVFEACDFTEADLTNANLQDSKLVSAKLERAVLTGANLENAQMAEAGLSRSNLARAKLLNTDLSRADLTQADLSRADLRNANLSQAVLDRADLSWADVIDTIVDDSTRFSAAKTTGVDFGTNWLLRQRVLDSAHELTILHFCRKHRVAGFLWWAMLGCGKRNYLLLIWGIAIVFLFAGLMALHPSSFDFGQPTPSFGDHLRNSLAVFVTLDLAVDKGTDTYGRSVMLVEMLMSYLMLGFMASLFSSIFPRSPD
ncbi:MAG: pentapeptide repeat-containing protein [Planctomycetales bacterium]|nr:pentapeptide repeat-containing protein [Planctomycetales bacterium]